jgi:hypothetical protein
MGEFINKDQKMGRVRILFHFIRLIKRNKRKNVKIKIKIKEEISSRALKAKKEIKEYLKSLK